MTSTPIYDRLTLELEFDPVKDVSVGDHADFMRAHKQVEWLDGLAAKRRASFNKKKTPARVPNQSRRGKR